MEKSEIIKRFHREVRIGRSLWLGANNISDPKQKLELEKRAAIHYSRAHKLLKKVNG
jgi:hypothetical protein